MNLDLLPLVFAALLEVLFVDITSGACQELHQNPLFLREKEGRISFSVSRDRDDCTWKLPLAPNNGHALVMYVRNIDMKVRSGSRCTGSLTLPNVGPTCRVSPVCRIYVSQNSSCRISEISPKLYRWCTKNVVYMDDRAQREVRFRSEKPGDKSFTLLYKYVDCATSVNVQRSLKSNIAQPSPTRDYLRSLSSETIAVKHVNGSALDAKQEKQSDLFQPTFAAIVSIIVILAILLVATCVMLFLMYKRKEKATTFQNPAVVAYVHDRTDEDGLSSTQISPEYLEFPTPTGVGSESPEEQKNVYAEIGRNEATSEDFFSFTVRDRHYENIDETQSDHTVSTGNLDMEELPSNYTYAKVNKLRKSNPDISL